MGTSRMRGVLTEALEDNLQDLIIVGVKKEIVGEVNNSQCWVMGLAEQKKPLKKIWLRKIKPSVRREVSNRKIEV